jgi:hypothetical protein
MNGKNRQRSWSFSSVETYPNAAQEVYLNQDCPVQVAIILDNSDIWMTSCQRSKLKPSQ